MFLFLAACAVIWAVPPGFASAQSNVSINEHGVENQFPDGLRFHISASSESRIEEIRVYVRKLGQSNRSSYRSVEFEPGQSISGEVLFRSKTANEYIPTGTHLSYYFQILTADGANTETAPQSVVYLNTGLDWQTASAGLINVYYYHHNDQSETRANAVLNVAAGTYEFMAPILGVELIEPMSIVVYSDYSHMLDALQPASLVAAQRLRTLGKAFTNERTLLVDGSLSNILSTAAHEFTHLLVADAAGSAYTGVDSWLNEGLAVYSERDPDSEFNRLHRPRNPAQRCATAHRTGNLRRYSRRDPPQLRPGLLGSLVHARYLRPERDGRPVRRAANPTQHGKSRGSSLRTDHPRARQPVEAISGVAGRGAGYPGPAALASARHQPAQWWFSNGHPASG